jgi:hypothetical protein
VKKTVRCQYCSRPAQLLRGDVLYPRRPDLAQRRFWRCEPCDAHVGCHPGTEKPLGRLAKANLRELKQFAHGHFDPIWRSGGMGRAEAYRWLADKLGIPAERCHIGWFDERMCCRVIEVCAAENIRRMGL